jgi:hypothetical protein
MRERKLSLIWLSWSARIAIPLRRRCTQYICDRVVVSNRPTPLNFPCDLTFTQVLVEQQMTELKMHLAQLALLISDQGCYWRMRTAHRSQRRCPIAGEHKSNPTINWST